MVAEKREQLGLNVPQVAELLGLGTSKTWELVWSKQLRSIRAGKRVIIPRQAIADFLAGQPQEPVGV